MVFPRIHNTQQSQGGGRQGYTATEFLEFAETNHVFDAVIAVTDDLVMYRQGEGTEQFYGANVTPGTFEFFGLPALHGRVPNDTERSFSIALITAAIACWYAALAFAVSPVNEGVYQARSSKPAQNTRQAR